MPNDDERWSDDLSGAWERHRTELFEAQRHVSDWLVDEVDPQEGETILDLAAGPGETGFLAAVRVGPTGRLISTDLNEGMVDAARRGAEAAGLANVECRVLDAQENDLPDDSVDAAICRYGVMLMPAPDRALHHVRRVLRDGGRFAYAVWGPMEGNPWLALLAMSVIQHGHQPPGDPFGAGGIFSLAQPDANRDLATAAGFTDVCVVDLRGSFRYESFDAYWTVQTEVSGPLAVLIAALPPDEQAAIRATLSEAVTPFRSGDGYEFPSHALGIAAR